MANWEQEDQNNELFYNIDMSVEEAEETKGSANGLRALVTNNWHNLEEGRAKLGETLDSVDAAHTAAKERKRKDQHKMKGILIHDMVIELDTSIWAQ